MSPTGAQAQKSGPFAADGVEVITGQKKSSDITPAIVRGRPFIMSVRPTTAGSRAEPLATTGGG